MNNLNINHQILGIVHLGFLLEISGLRRWACGIRWDSQSQTGPAQGKQPAVDDWNPIYIYIYIYTLWYINIDPGR